MKLTVAAMALAALTADQTSGFQPQTFLPFTNSIVRHQALFFTPTTTNMSTSYGHGRVLVSQNMVGGGYSRNDGDGDRYFGDEDYGDGGSGSSGIGSGGGGGSFRGGSGMSRRSGRINVGVPGAGLFQSDEDLGEPDEETTKMIQELRARYLSSRPPPLPDVNDLDPANFEQTMTNEERKENLEVIRQIHNHDLKDLQLRQDYAGMMEAKKDKQRREDKDPWFQLNKMLKEAIQLDMTDDIEKIKNLIEKVGGPPPGVVPRIFEYARMTDIYEENGMSLARAELLIEQELREENHKFHRARLAESRANEKREEEDRKSGRAREREEEEARQRREANLAKFAAEVAEEEAKKREKAAEIEAKYREKYPDWDTTSPLDRALKEARKAIEKERYEATLPEGSAEKERIRRGDDDYDYDDEDYDDDDYDVEGREDDDDDEDDDYIDELDDEGRSSARPRKAATSSDGRPRMPGDEDVMMGEIEGEVSDNSDVTTDDRLRVEVTSGYNAAQSDPPMRKHCFQYTIKITNVATGPDARTIQLIGRRFEIQTVLARRKDIVSGQGVTGRQPVLKPGETFEYTSTAPLSVRPIGTTIIAARMSGVYHYSIVDPNIAEADRAVNEAVLGTFHFIFPPEQRVIPFRYEDDDDEDDDDFDDDDDDNVSSRSSTPSPASSSSAPSPSAGASTTPAAAASPSTTLPGDADMISGKDLDPPNCPDSSEAVTEEVRVAVSSQYREERSDSLLNKHCFAYNIRITNERSTPIQLVSRRFEIQTVGSKHKDVVQGPGVTGRQPVLQPGESFEYTSTAPLNVSPLPNTPVVARMSGEYRFLVLAEDGSGPLRSDPLVARLATFHFVLPQYA